MLNDGNAAGLLRSGDSSGLEQLFNQGQYEQCLNLAEKQTSQAVPQQIEPKK